MTAPSPRDAVVSGEIPAPVAATPPLSTPTLVETEKVPRSVVAVLAVLAVSALVMMLNETALSVALPQLMADFQISATSVQWLTTGFLLTMAVVIPATGFLVQRFTTRTLFIAALTLFVVGTALATLAPSFGFLLLARVIQAGGTAIIMPLLMTTTLTSVPPKHRGTVMGLNAIVISVAPAIGPTLAGFIVGAQNWRWLFGLMLPIGILALILGIFLIRTSNQTTRPPLDIASVIISAFAFGGLVYGLSSISAIASGAWAPVLGLVLGAVALTVFVLRQVRLQRKSAAYLDLRPFTAPNFRVSVVIVAIAMATMLGTVMVLPIYLQNGLGLSVVTTGLILLPGGLIQGVLAPFIGRTYDRFGPRPLVIPGVLLLAGGQWWLATLGTDTSVGLIVAMHVTFCIGMALLMTPLMTVSLGSLPRNLYGHGSAITNTLMQLGGAVGAAVLIAAMSIGAAAAGNGVPENAALAQGAQTAFVVGGVLGLVAVICAPFVRRLDTLR